MFQVVGNVKQYHEFEKLQDDQRWNVPKIVLELIKEKITIFDEWYGSDRDLTEDLGGYCVVFPCVEMRNEEEYQKLMFKFRLQKEQYEYRDILLRQDGFIWVEELFLLSSDYGLVVFYAEKEEAEEND